MSRILKWSDHFAWYPCDWLVMSCFTINHNNINYISVAILVLDSHHSLELEIRL